MRLLVGIGLLLVVLPGWGKEYTFEPLTTSDGLSQNDVITIFQSSDGYMWFATIDGLNRFDGYDFKVFQVAVDGSNSVSSNLMAGIYEDQNRNLWVGTLNRGVFKYNMVTEEFTHFYNTPENPDLVTENFVYHVFCDSKNRVWVSTYKGIYCIIQNEDGTHDIHKFQHNNDDPYSLSDNIVYSVNEDSKGNIWVCNYSSLDRMVMGSDNAVNNQFVHYGTELNIWDLGEIVEIDEGYVFTHHTGAHLLQFEGDNWECPKYTALSNFPCKPMERDQFGNIWIGSHLGIVLLEYQPGSTPLFKETHHFTVGQTDNTLNHQFIRSLMLDNSGIMWIGTNGGGVSRYNPQKTKFRHYKHTALKGSLSNNKVWSITEDQRGNLWVGTEGGGVNLLPKEKKRNYFTGFKSYAVNPADEQNFVFDIIELSGQPVPTLWAGIGYESKLASITFKNQGWQVNEQYTSSFFYIISLTQDEYNNVWAGSYDDGLIKHVLTIPEQQIVYTPGNSKLPSKIIRCITEDSRGRLWIGTTEGLAVISREDKKKYAPNFIIFTNEEADSTSISHNYIVPIVESSTGEIWIGTFGGGLNRYVEGSNLFNGHFERFTTKEGLPSNTIKDIIEDEEGFLWISSNKGLSRFDLASRNFRNFDDSDGLQAPSFADRSGCKRKDGEILFGGVNGFNAFYPHEISEDTVTPRLVFNNFEIFNRTINTREEINGRVLLQKAINNTQFIRLKHKENNFAIHFAGLHYSSPQKTRYKYQLEGYDEEWYLNEANRRYAKYTNLKPGHYTFRFTAANSDGYWNPVPKEIDIEIIPPVWATLWFRITFVLMISILIIVIFQYRTRQIRRRNIELQLAVEARTREIEQKNSILRSQTQKLDETNTILQTRQHLIEKQAHELTAQRDELIEANGTKDKLFSIVAHDLKDSFNALSGYLELYQLQFESLDNTEKKTMLDRAVGSIDNIRELLLNLLMWSRAQNGTIQFKPEKRNIIEIIKDVINTVTLQASDKDIDISFKTSIPGILVSIDIELIKTVLRNVLSNAIKFTNKGGSVELTFKSLQKEVAIRVSDNGVGISEENMEKLFRKDQHLSTRGTSDEHGTGLGLITCKEFIELHGGTITLESIEGNGTIVHISLPK